MRRYGSEGPGGTSPRPRGVDEALGPEPGHGDEAVWSERVESARVRATAEHLAAVFEEVSRIRALGAARAPGGEWDHVLACQDLLAVMSRRAAGDAALLREARQRLLRQPAGCTPAHSAWRRLLQHLGAARTEGARGATAQLTAELVDAAARRRALRVMREGLLAGALRTRLAATTPAERCRILQRALDRIGVVALATHEQAETAEQEMRRAGGALLNAVAGAERARPAADPLEPAVAAATAGLGALAAFERGDVEAGVAAVERDVRPIIDRAVTALEPDAPFSWMLGGVLDDAVAAEAPLAPHSDDGAEEARAARERLQRLARRAP